MKKFLTFSISVLFGTGVMAQVDPTPASYPTNVPALIQNQPNPPRKIQIAILFDTSNSMDGLIEQAKSTIWQIVNAATNLRHAGATPTIEIGLYDYGNQDIPASTGYIRKQTDLITDLDSISEKLFGLRTHGGDEYCGAVIQSSLRELNWSVNPEDLKIIYIAGNEPFNQGSVAYKGVMELAVSRHIIVNTIYCGPYQQGVREFWYDGAQQAKGSYFNIDSNKEVYHIDTPYDTRINTLNDSLNGTYISYGFAGKQKKEKQVYQDYNASTKGSYNKAERAVVKSKSTYKNSSWDIVDAEKDGTKKVTTLSEEELPDELKGKTSVEKEAFVKQKSEERVKYQQEIGELAKQREAYIAEEKKKNTAAAEGDLGSSIIQSLYKSATTIGFYKENQ